MSSGQRKVHHGFNPVQIKDGWIVVMRKDGRIKSRLEKWNPKPPRKEK